jgi:peptide/nickel transport system substrate-binding protein
MLSVVALVLVACGGGGDDSDSSSGSGSESETTEAVELQQGGSVIYARQTEPRNFDPAKMQVGPIAGIVAQTLYDQLFYQGEDGEPEPGLATSLEADDANKVFTIKLREDVTFSDGTPFDADAVIAHWTRMKDPATASPGILDASEIQTMEAVDPLTLEVTLVAPDATFSEPLMVGNMTYIPSPTAVQSAGASYGTSPETTVGAGPFLLKEVVFSDHQTYARNPDYWDAPKPYLDEMTFKTFLDGQARFNTFVSGGADLIENLTAGQSNIELDRDYTNVSPLPLGGGYGFAFRTDTGPTADPRVRQAMAYAVDIDSVLERANPGSTVAHTLYDEDAGWYTDLDLPYNDPEKAQELLDDYLADTGQSEVTVDIIHAETSAPFMEALQQEWQKFDGLTVNVTIETNVQTASRIASRDYPGGLVSAVGGTPRALKNQLTSGARTNVSFLSDPEMDAALKAASETTDPDTVNEAMTTVAERFNAMLPYFIFNRLNSATWLTDELGGVHGMALAPVVWKTQELGFVQ